MVDTNKEDIGSIVKRTDKSDANPLPAKLISFEEEVEDNSPYDKIMERLGYQKYMGLDGKRENLYLSNEGVAIFITFLGEVGVRFGYSLNGGNSFTEKEINDAGLKDMATRIVSRIHKEGRKATSCTFCNKNSVIAFEYLLIYNKFPDERILKSVETQANDLKKEINSYTQNYLKERIDPKNIKLAPAKIVSDLLEKEQIRDLKAYLKKAG